MKIYVSHLPPEGLTDRATYDPTMLDMDCPDIHAREPFTVEAVITKAEQEVVVHAAISAPLRLTCARCLEEFPFTVRTSSVFSYKVQPTDVVDITDDVRQEVILAYPMVCVCRQTCKGLCRVCGQNLNTAPCGHYPN